MSGIIYAAAGTGFTFAMTALGAAVVFFIKKDSRDERLQKVFLGFAAGVMIAASVWSLLIPAIDEAEALGKAGWIPSAGGFVLGVAFLMLLDKLLPFQEETAQDKGARGRMMLIFAITLHNLPEGMAVGLAFALAAKNDSSVLLASAMALALGMGIQNFPEGAAISLPIRQGGASRKKAFLYGAGSGLVEPVFGCLTVLIAGAAEQIMPWLLSFAAGAMLYVVADELIPEAKIARSDIGTLGVMAGFVLMMVLDVALG